MVARWQQVRRAVGGDGGFFQYVMPRNRLTAWTPVPVLFVDLCVNLHRRQGEKVRPSVTFRCQVAILPRRFISTHTHPHTVAQHAPAVQMLTYLTLRRLPAAFLAWNAADRTEQFQCNAYDLHVYWLFAVAKLSRGDVRPVHRQCPPFDKWACSCHRDSTVLQVGASVQHHLQARNFCPLTPVRIPSPQTLSHHLRALDACAHCPLSVMCSPAKRPPRDRPLTHTLTPLRPIPKVAVKTWMGGPARAFNRLLNVLVIRGCAALFVPR